MKFVTRIFWIAGFSITVLMFAGMTLLCVIALFEKHHLNGTGWTMFVCSLCSTWFMFGRLRAAIRFGDPTAGLNSGEESRTLDARFIGDRDSR